ncbi:MAG: amidohydrolase family protein [Rhodospirillaceae bacterium]|nr:amidohydrolase family protein [Rhodospirillaceae bacterium]
MPIIDADTHVVEAACIWDYLAKDDAIHRPATITMDEVPEAFKQRAMSGRKFWLIDGKMYGLGGLPTDMYAPGTRDLTDVPARIAHMDRLGVDKQVIYPSVFLNLVVKNPAAEMALSKAYNRWLADVCAPTKGRMRWLVVPAPRLMDASLAEIAWGQQHGACGVLLRGYEGDRALDDPDLYPIYAKAQDLDMPVCVHIGTTSPSFHNIAHGTGIRGNIVATIMPTMVAFSALMASEVPTKFPKLRFGFIEGGSEWLPFAVNRTRRWAKRFGEKDRTEKMLSDLRFFVTCEIHEDLPQVLRTAGEDNLMLGTDYGHADTSTELAAHEVLLARKDLGAGVAAKIVGPNAARFYGV